MPFYVKPKGMMNDLHWLSSCMALRWISCCKKANLEICIICSLKFQITTMAQKHPMSIVRSVREYWEFKEVLRDMDLFESFYLACPEVRTTVAISCKMYETILGS